MGCRSCDHEAATKIHFDTSSDGLQAALYSSTMRFGSISRHLLKIHLFPIIDGTYPVLFFSSSPLLVRRCYSNHPSSYHIITFSNSSLVAYDDVCNLDLQRWESLWKILATIGVANLLLFFIIVFVLVIDNSIMIWILIGIESACYLGVLIVSRHIRQLLR